MVEERDLITFKADLFFPESKKARGYIRVERID